MKIGKFVASVKRTAAIVLAATSLGATAEEPYQFIISGYPAANESYVTASPGTSIETATRARPTAAQPLEARYHTWDETNGIALRSDKRGMIIILR